MARDAHFTEIKREILLNQQKAKQHVDYYVQQ